MSYFIKFKGLSEPIPPRPSVKQICYIWLGSFISVCIIGFLAYYTNQPLILGSFGASIFVLFVLQDTPLAQPRNVIGGHFLATLVGLIFFHMVSIEWWSMALSLAFSVSLMVFLRVSHPPAASNPLIVFFLLTFVIW